MSINVSYRTRGKLHRAQIKIKPTIIVFIKIKVLPKKNTVVKNLKNKIDPYSAMKIRAKSPPPYSMLNPDTISDSPSAMSNGVRLVSAMHRVIQTVKNGREIKAPHIFCCNKAISTMS